jgi:hypothetical protein
MLRGKLYELSYVAVSVICNDSKSVSGRQTISVHKYCYAFTDKGRVWLLWIIVVVLYLLILCTEQMVVNRPVKLFVNLLLVTTSSFILLIRRI